VITFVTALPSVLLNEELRLLYRLDRPALAPEHRAGWLALGVQIKARAVRQACPHRSSSPPRHPRCDPPRAHNGRPEGLNIRIRLTSHRSVGFTPPQPSSPSSTSAAPGSRSPYRGELHHQTVRSTKDGPPGRSQRRAGGTILRAAASVSPPSGQARKQHGCNRCHADARA
jgi:hypothetical protein